MKRLKILTSLFITSSIVLSSTIAYAGEWIKSGNDWRYLQDNSSYAAGWLNDNGKWYYMSTNGVMQTGWIQDGANWYYLNADGSMAVNTVIDGYTLGASGAWVTNPFQEKAKGTVKAGSDGASAQSMSEQNGYQDNTQSSSSSGGSHADYFKNRQGTVKAGTNGASAQSMSEANK